MFLVTPFLLDLFPAGVEKMNPPSSTPETKGGNQPESRTAGRPRQGVDVSGKHVDTGTAAPEESAHPRRRCSKAKCTKVLPLTSNDAHKVCISCRKAAGLQCSIEERCEECGNWPDDLVRSAHSYQIKLGKSKPKSKIKKANASKSPPSSCSSPDVTAPPSALSEQQLKALLTSDSIRGTLATVIAQTMGSLLSVSPTASSELASVALPTCTASQQHQRQSDTIDRQLDDYRSARAGSEPTGEAGVLGGVSTERAPPPPPPKRLCVEVVGAGRPELLPGPPTHEPGGNTVWLHKSQQCSINAQGEGMVVAGNMLSEASPTTQPERVLGLGGQTRPPPPMSKAPMRASSQGTRMGWPQIHQHERNTERFSASRFHSFPPPYGETRPHGELLQSGLVANTFSIQGHSTDSRQAGVGYASVPTPSSHGWASGERCNHYTAPLPHPPLPQPGGDGGGQDTDAPGTVFKHTPDQAIHLAEQFTDTVHRLPHAQAIQTAGVQEDNASQPDQTNREDAEVEDFDTPLLDFRKVLQFVFETLPEAQGAVQRDYMPRAAGMPHLSTPPPLFKLHHSQLIEHAMTHASHSLQASATSTRPSWIPLPKLSPAYRSASGNDRPAVLNPDLAAHIRGSLEPRVTLSQREISQLETAILDMRNMLNFMIWFTGAFAFHTAPLLTTSPDAPMLERVLSSLERAFTHQSRVSAISLANIQSRRRESYIASLPSRFEAAAKRKLRSSPLDQEFLFGQQQVAEATAMAREAASLSLSEATARALARPSPRTGTPLVDRSTHVPLPANRTDSAPSTSQPKNRRVASVQHGNRQTSFHRFRGRWKGPHTSRR